YSVLAAVLLERGKVAEAEPLQRKSLDTYRRLLGESHPDTVIGWSSRALLLTAQGRYVEAEAAARAAADGYRAARRRVSDVGLERAGYAAERSPLPGLAALRARLHQPRLAWESLEEDLGRALFDELSNPLDEAGERRRQLLWRIERLDERLLAL